MRNALVWGKVLHCMQYWQIWVLMLLYMREFIIIPLDHRCCRKKGKDLWPFDANAWCIAQGTFMMHPRPQQFVRLILCKSIGGVALPRNECIRCMHAEGAWPGPSPKSIQGDLMTQRSKSLTKTGGARCSGLRSRRSSRKVIQNFRHNSEAAGQS